MSEEQNNNKEEQKIKRGKNFDVFISYRRSDGTDKAKQLDLAFSIDDCRTFFDFKSLGTGAFDKRLENAVLDAPIFIMVWTPDYFKRCVKGGETADGKTVFEPDEDDWVRKEIELALKHNKKIIPINFNHVLDKVPDYLDDEFRNKISPHNYVNLYGDNTFDATVKHIFDKEIRPFIGATPKPENKVKVRVKADADCELIDNDEVIATIQQGKTAQLFFERGEYELIARSTEFSDIENVIERTFDDVSFSYFVKTELAYRVQQRRIQIEEEEKKKREEEERIRREEEERIRREEEERRRREEEQRLAEQKKKEEEQRRKEEEARLEAERQRQEYLRKEEEARKLLEQERERQRREAEERIRANQARLEEEKEREKNQNQTEINLEPEIWLEKYAWWHFIPIFVGIKILRAFFIGWGMFFELWTIVFYFIFGLLFEAIIKDQKKKKGCIQIRAKKRWRYIFPVISLCVYWSICLLFAFF